MIKYFIFQKTPPKNNVSQRTVKKQKRTSIHM